MIFHGIFTFHAKSPRACSNACGGARNLNRHACSMEEPSNGPRSGTIDPWAADGLSLTVPQGTLGLHPHAVMEEEDSLDEVDVGDQPSSTSSAPSAALSASAAMHLSALSKTARPLQQNTVSCQTDVSVPFSQAGDRAWAGLLAALAGPAPQHTAQPPPPHAPQLPALADLAALQAETAAALASLARHRRG